MSDLISRSKLLKEIETWGGCVEALHEYIEKMPTAYDIDKVVEELDCDRCESCSFLKVCAGSECCTECRKKIIEIVKQGGVCGGCTEAGGCPVREDCPNEPNVCEWKYKGGFIKNPHTNRIFSNEESMKNIYCNTCGKKIKAVE